MNARTPLSESASAAATRSPLPSPPAFASGDAIRALISARSMLLHIGKVSNYLSLPGADLQREFDDHILLIDKALAAFGQDGPL